ncbi:MAG: hypothetical protein ACTHLU_03520 [Novosphingobium sp.]
MPALRLALILIAPLALVACGSGTSDKKQKDRRIAVGEILPGSVSDAMLPYDTVRSQPPLAPRESGRAGGKAGEAAEAEAAASDAPAASAEGPTEVPAEPAPVPVR